MRNHLRGRIAVQVDGGLRTGRDIVIGALLGADEFGFGTIALIAAGCVMMRKCHLNTCPVGVATQDPELRKRFPGQPAHVINLFTFLIEGSTRTDGPARFPHLQRNDRSFRPARHAAGHPSLEGARTGFQPVCWPPASASGRGGLPHEAQDHGLDSVLDRQLIAQARPALDEQQPVRMDLSVRNTDRTVGAMLSGQVAQRHGHRGYRTTPSTFTSRAPPAKFSAPSWHAASPSNWRASERLCRQGGSAVGESPSIRPLKRLASRDNIIVGNTVLYGAVAGECYFRGMAGERFAVRNSGALTVVEGVGDHGCGT